MNIEPQLLTFLIQSTALLFIYFGLFAFLLKKLGANEKIPLKAFQLALAAVVISKLSVFLNSLVGLGVWGLFIDIALISSILINVLIIKTKTAIFSSAVIVISGWYLSYVVLFTILNNIKNT